MNLPIFLFFVSIVHMAILPNWTYTDCFQYENTTFVAGCQGLDDMYQKNATMFLTFDKRYKRVDIEFSYTIVDASPNAFLALICSSTGQIVEFIPNKSITKRLHLYHPSLIVLYLGLYEPMLPTQYLLYNATLYYYT